MLSFTRWIAADHPIDCNRFQTVWTAIRCLLFQHSPDSLLWKSLVTALKTSELKTQSLSLNNQYSLFQKKIKIPKIFETRERVSSELLKHLCNFKALLKSLLKGTFEKATARECRVESQWRSVGWFLEILAELHRHFKAVQFGNKTRRVAQVEHPNWTP